MTGVQLAMIGYGTFDRTSAYRGRHALDEDAVLTPIFPR